jgi:hypothetical protein
LSNIELNIWMIGWWTKNFKKLKKLLSLENLKKEKPFKNKWERKPTIKVIENGLKSRWLEKNKKSIKILQENKNLLKEKKKIGPWRTLMPKLTINSGNKIKSLNNHIFIMKMKNKKFLMPININRIKQELMENFTVH